MKFDAPIKIDIFEFVARGAFDCVVPGQNKHHLRNCFPDPDDEFITIHDMSIWSYGNLELHFDENDVLILIWCDRFQAFNGGPSLEVDPWIIRHPNPPRLPEVIDCLSKSRIDFTITFKPELGSANLRILKSNVDLHFEPNKAFENDVGYFSEEYTRCGSDEFELLAIGLSYETY